MAIPVSDANDINTVLLWAMGHAAHYPGGPALTDEDATEAARRLAARSYKTLMAGLRAGDVTLTRNSALDAPGGHAENHQAGPPLLTRAQISEWAGLGRDLTDAELARLATCIPRSSIPDAIAAIVTDAMRLTGPGCGDD